MTNIFGLKLCYLILGVKNDGKTRKCIKYVNIVTEECHYNTMHGKYVYEVYNNDETTEQMTATMIAENKRSQVNSEVNHYQVLTVVTEHKIYVSSIIKLVGFIKYLNEKLHRKRKKINLKLVVK